MKTIFSMAYPWQGALMRFILLVLTCFLTLSSSFYALSDSPCEITWAYTNDPPAYITEGTHAGTGFGQRLTEQVISRLPSYNHKFMEATFPRIMSELKSGKGVCYATLHKQQERSEYISFSRAALVSPKSWFLSTKGKVENLLEDKKINIEKILDNRNLVIAKLQGRSYGAMLDGVLQNQKRLNSMILSSQQKLIELVAIGRIDGTFVHSGELAFFEAGGNSATDLVLHEIAGVTSYLPGFIGCAKTKWGQHAILHINEAVEQLANTKEYMKAITSWWGEESDSDEFNYAIDTFLQNN